MAQPRKDEKFNESRFMKKILFFLITSILIATSLMAAPQAIVFDFGGVLTGEPNREAIVHFIRNSFHFSQEQFEAVNLEKRLALKQGKTDEEFWVAYAKENGIHLPSSWVESFKSVMKDSIGVNSEMYALVEELRAQHMPVALLSNIDGRLSKLIRDFGLYDPFDPCLLSCEIGIEKPDPKAYEFLLTRLNLPAAEVVFIDDKLENIEGAKGVGLDAILFESPGQIREELKKRGYLQEARGALENQ
jgi:epoxide hydrolase-like predicted phosphatase